MKATPGRRGTWRRAGPAPGSSASTPLQGDMVAILAGDEPPGATEEEPPAQLAKSPWPASSRSCHVGLHYLPTTKAMPPGALPLSQGPFLQPGLWACGLSSPSHLPDDHPVAQQTLPHSPQSLAWRSGCRNLAVAVFLG